MIMVRTLSAITVAMSLSTLSAVAQKSKATAPDYFPLRVGDSWTYRNTSDGSQYSLKVVSEEKQADGSVRYHVEKLAGVKILTWFSKVSGWVLMHLESYPEHEGLQAAYEPARQYLKNPLVTGSNWTWKGKDQTQTDIEETNKVFGFEKVTVPAGKFRAIKVVSQVGGGVQMTKTYWYAEGVGLIKSTTEGRGITYGSELAAYSFKKK